MNRRVKLFVAVSDSFCWLCVYWIVAATMVMAKRGWNLGLLWLLVWALLSAACGVLLLRKARSFSFLMLLGVGLSAAGLAFFIVLSATKLSVLHVLTLAVGAGMASGMPLYYLLHQPPLTKHLNALDVLLLAFAALLLLSQSREFPVGTETLIVLVLLLDIAAGVGLRMTADGSSQGAWKAVLAALGSSVVVAALVALLTALFSRSGKLTGGVLGGLWAGLRWLGRLLESFFQWFAMLFYRKPEYVDMGEIDMELPSLAGADETVQLGQQSMAWIGVLLGIVVLAVLVSLLIVLRRQKWAFGTEELSAMPAERQTRIRGGLSRRWRELLDALGFRWTALLRRNSPPGLLVYLEQRAKRAKKPRRKGETVRAFLQRMAPGGELSALADDLDARFYAKSPYRLSAAECRTLRKTIHSL